MGSLMLPVLTWRPKLYLTSSAVNSRPLCHLTPLRSLNTYVRGSVCCHDSARPLVMLPSGCVTRSCSYTCSKWCCETMGEDSCGSRPAVGSWFSASFNEPPRLAPPAAGLATAGAVVGAAAAGALVGATAWAGAVVGAAGGLAAGGVVGL